MGDFGRVRGHGAPSIVDDARGHYPTTLKDPEWNNTTVLDSGDATAQVRKLKEEFDGELQVPGSHRLVQELIESDLVDQINLMVFPVILGTGKKVRRRSFFLGRSGISFGWLAPARRSVLLGLPDYSTLTRNPDNTRDRVGRQQASDRIKSKKRAVEGVDMGENRDNPANDKTSESGPLAGGRAITKVPVQDLDRARAFYQDKLGLAPVEEREGGLRYLCAAGEFHLFVSTGASSGTFTQMGFEVEDLGATVAGLRTRGVVFEEFDLPDFEVEDGIVKVEDNYPSKGVGERGIWFRDSEGNLLALGQPVE